MKNSEIFDSFVKIAQEKGMISNDSSASKKKLEQTGRADSLDISAIEALYGVKGSTSKDMEYEKNIMEVAHPNSIVISPSYDKLNGLVESEIERQNINLHIVNKTPDGLQTKHKYAEKELTLSLVRIANDLDNRNEDSLRTLADFCLLQVSKKKIKKVANPLAIALVVGAAAILGGLYLKQHIGLISDGIEKDHQKLISEIDDLINSNSNWGVGYKYKPEFIQMMRSFRDKLTAFYGVYSQIAPAIDELEKPRDAAELLQVANSPKTINFIKYYNAFKNAANSLYPMIKKIQENFANESYKQRQIQDKGALTSLIDAPQIFHGGKGLIADDFDDVRHALDTYVNDIANVSKVLSEAENLKQKATTEMQEASMESNTLLGPGPSENTSNRNVSDIDQEGGDLEKQLKEHGFLG